MYLVTGLNPKCKLKKTIQITKKTVSLSLMLSKTFPTLFLSSLDLFIGQECSSTCSDRALQVERVGGKDDGRHMS